MRKKILIVLGTIIVGIALILIFQKPDAIDVPDDKNEHLGQRFETKINLIVSYYKNSKDWDLNRPGGGMPELEEVKHPPYNWYGHKIQGILPKGSIFRIVGEKISTSKTSGGGWFMAEIESEGPFKGKIVSTNSLEYYANGLIYKPEYAEEITKEAK